MKLSNYSLSYGREFSQGKMDVFQFLSLCRQLGLEGASLHVRNLESTQPDYLKRVRRAYLDQGLSVSMFTVTTNFGLPEDRHAAEFARAREAIEAAVLLGAPLLRIFPGGTPSEAERPRAFARAAAAVRRLCDEAARVGLPIGLQNHNHNELCRTGAEVIRFLKLVDHPNLVFVLDTGQFAGSKGASARPGSELLASNYLQSIRQTAPLARYVRAKFYNPDARGAEPVLDYDEIFKVLQSVHYAGFIDIVYEPGKGTDGGGEPAATAIPRVVKYLRGKLREVEDEGGPAPAAAPRYQGLENNRFFAADDVRVEAAVAFTEGPVADADGNVFFVNIPFEQILKWDVKQRKLTVFRDKSNAANGLRFDRQGGLIACEGGAGRVTRTALTTGMITVLADQYEGKPLGAPNDLELDAKGRIYFTSRLPNRDPKAGNVNAVYRIDPDGRIARLVAWPDIDMPNGLATSPDDSILYLIDADGTEKGSRRIRAYDLRPDGTLANGRLLYDFYPGRSGDGMKVDAEGNLWVMAGLHRRRGSHETLDTRPGIHVISPKGKLLAFLETPEDTITNCAFGGPDLKTLYVTCGKLLLSVPTRVPGKSAYRNPR
jgi:gluconolactonase